MFSVYLPLLNDFVQGLEKKWLNLFRVYFALQNFKAGI